jgi:hypothetical protein
MRAPLSFTTSGTGWFIGANDTNDSIDSAWPRPVPDGVLDLHTSGGYFLPCMTMADNGWTGESLGLFPDWRKEVGLNSARVNFQSRQFGFYADTLFMHHHPVPPEYGQTITELHGLAPRPNQGMFLDRAAALWSLADRFDVSGATWIPYYDAAKGPFQANDSRVLCSAYVHPGKRALLLLSNWSDEPVDGRIEIDWKALGLASAAPIKLLNFNRIIHHDHDSIRLAMQPRRLYYLWIGAEESPGR